MFGYITPDDPYLFKKDETLYKALYCGLCKSIGAGCGQRARTALTYDMAFMSALVHNIRGEDVKIEKSRCAVHLIRKRPIAAVDELTVALGCVNTALAYFKLCDDHADGDKKGVFRHLYKKGFKRAKKRYPELAAAIERYAAAQTALEREGCAIIDAAAEPTAELMREISGLLLGKFSNRDTDVLFYSLGKWVYLIDALDDYDKDVKKRRYNVFFNAYGAPTFSEARERFRAEIEFIFNALFAEMRESLSKIDFHFNHDLTDNIILRGIPIKTRTIFNGDCKKGERNEQKES